MTDDRFTDRNDAGERLAESLAAYRGRRDVIVLGLPRGGVVVAARVAERLGAPLDVIVVRKLNTPGRRELAMGALAVWADVVEVVRNEDVIADRGISGDRFEAVRSAELELARRRVADYALPPVGAAGQTVVVVDDGLATGATVRAALLAARRGRPGHLVLAVPVASRDGLADAGELADEVHCVLTPRSFLSVAQAYLDFGEVSDDVVHRELAAAAERAHGG